ncbi:potassium-transporting ATPase subunit KdpC [Halalkalibacter alkalisediminis]|uniref:Potassium-transporting ATPase KdpC subunit n=1 Tax=Halalkalibacter alkalisediminis TaxID=935616 RepID=A0ABV6NNP7_9BACI|nr:potassium-transporting ATPase subunit KdpC [Halalkalibacter alkalisediminis]
MSIRGSVKSMVGTIIRASFLLMLVAGLLYPVAVTGIAQAVLPDQANGSLIYNENNEVIGSELIGQSFNSPFYFHGRVSSIEYDAMGSGSENYGPSNIEMIERTTQLVEQWESNNPQVPVQELPIDLVTNSASGLDPHISPAAAYAQVPRISDNTGIFEQDLFRLIVEHTEGRELGLFGEQRVNVLLLNLSLSELIE